MSIKRTYFISLRISFSECRNSLCYCPPHIFFLSSSIRMFVPMDFFIFFLQWRIETMSFLCTYVIYPHVRLFVSLFDVTNRKSQATKFSNHILHTFIHNLASVSICCAIHELCILGSLYDLPMQVPPNPIGPGKQFIRGF